MKNAFPDADAARYQNHEFKQQGSLEITVVGVDETQQLFIEEAISDQYRLKFLSVTPPIATIRSGTLAQQGLLLFLVPTECALARRRIRLMKCLMSLQPGLNLIPLIPNKAVWDATRDSLAKHFPVYVPINFSNMTEKDFSARLRDCTVLHLPQIFEALAGSIPNNEATPEQIHKLYGQMKLKVAKLSDLILQMEQKLELASALALARKYVPAQKSAHESFFQLAGVSGPGRARVRARAIVTR